jgi:GT2 family glycosyltransferase/glycosyltransferase involved in cell wall biosynthesis
MASTSPAVLAFRDVATPEVSVIIPVFNQWELTRACLASIAASAPLERLEVIVVDDASTDATATELGRVSNVRVVRNAENAGFTRSANRGAAAARGRLLLFLNNDTRVCPGWVEGLLEAIAVPGVAAAGSRLLYPSGLLQEAGAVIWADGSGWNLGRGRSPRRPEYAYRREVDYCSAASLMVRADLFTVAGGFDERYAPAYYEDADLCFTLRALGHRVVYEPSSTVVHLEGATHGTERRRPVAGAHGKVNQRRNRELFAAKWAEDLSRRRSQPSRVTPREELLASRPDPRPRVLVCDVQVPTPDRDAGGQRMAWILRLLVPMTAHLTMAPTDRVDRGAAAEALRQDGIEVSVGGFRSFRGLLRSRRDLYDLVILSRPDVASARAGSVRRYLPHARLIFDTVDLHFRREERRLAVAGAVRTRGIARARALEMGLVRRCDVTATVTETEREVLRGLVPGSDIVVLPTVHELRPDTPPPFDARCGLLFIGSFGHEPNADAVAFLLDEILPRVRQRIDVPLVVIGGSPPPALACRAGAGVRFAGHVDDVVPLFDRARVFVSPLRFGAGMKGKNGQAMALGLPMVTTSIGAEGMDLVDGGDALIRDDPTGFADAVVCLHQDADLWRAIAENARREAGERWSPAAMRARLERLLRGADLEGGRERHGE